MDTYISRKTRVSTLPEPRRGWYRAQSVGYFYTASSPGALGCWSPVSSIVESLHSGDFAFDELQLKVAAAVLFHLTLETLDLRVLNDGGVARGEVAINLFVPPDTPLEPSVLD